MKFTILIVRPPGYRFSDCFKEPAETVMYGLRSLGHESEMTENGFRRGSRHILFGGHLLAADSVLPKDSILYNLEQVNGGHTGNLATLGRKYTLWDFAKPNCGSWEGLDVQARHVPIGYVPEMTRIIPADKDIDVLFYGSMNPRRHAIIEQLTRLGLNVISRVNDAYGAVLDSLIARAKVVLNIHYAATQLFEIVRVGYALANSKAVVSEQSVDDYPELKDGICITPYSALVDTCRHLSTTHKLRAALEGRALESFRRMPETQYLEAAL